MFFDVLRYQGRLPSDLRSDAVLHAVAIADGPIQTAVAMAAAVGLALDAAAKARKPSGLVLPSFGDHKANAYAYGEEVYEALIAAGHSRRDIVVAGNGVVMAILDARPVPVTEEDFQEALTPTEGAAAPTTSSGGASAPPTSGT